MYFDPVADDSPLVPQAGARATMAVNGALVLLLGIVPGPLVALCLHVIGQALAT